MIKDMLRGRRKVSIKPAGIESPELSRQVRSKIDEKATASSKRNDFFDGVYETLPFPAKIYEMLKWSISAIPLHSKPTLPAIVKAQGPRASSAFKNRHTFAVFYAFCKF